MPRPGRALLPMLLLAGLGASSLAAQEPGRAALATAYRDAARRICNDAAERFRSRLDAPDGREARFGLAASLLNAQPRTDARVEQADGLLVEVVAANPDDDLGIHAAYLRARIAQFHRQPGDPAAARTLYEALGRAHPQHPLAQMAAVKAFTLRIYDPAASAEVRRAAFDEAGRLVENYTDPDAQRDAHSLLAAACERFGYGDDARLRHLLAQERATRTRPDQRRDLTITIAEVARRLGQRELAAAYYRRFLADAPRDYRRYTAEQRLAEFNAPAVP